MKLSPRQWPEAATTIVRTYGVRGGALRFTHELRRRTGKFLDAPRYNVAPAPPGDAFSIDVEKLARASDRESAIKRAERILNGEFQAYRWLWRRLPATSREWLVHPTTGAQWPARDGWWQTPHIDFAAGDIKDLWEPARFGWAYDLVRAFLLSGDEKFAAAFYRHLDTFATSSPAFRGPHWSCGQETAIRATALLYAEANLRGAALSSGSGMRTLHLLLSASGERIADAIGYAVSQRNNHGISEAVGLICLGARFQNAHPDAAEWREKGKRLLARLIDEQFAIDGWYIQHSFNYMRLALDQCIVAARALRSIGSDLAPATKARLGAAMELLLAVVDPATGIVPNHGANDGAFVHPITLAAYSDFRPLLTALAAVLRRPLPADLTPDEEVLAWLRMAAPPSRAATGDGAQSGASGWAVARSGPIFVFIRAGRYTSRPSHLDPLHVDLRVDGRPVIADAGTFAYNGPPPWRNGLATSAVHNGPVLDDEEPGIRGPRFIWYSWPFARICRVAMQGTTAIIVAEVPGRVRRTLTVTKDGVVVDDEILAVDAGTVRVRWLLHPDASSDNIAVEGGGEIRAAREGDCVGWYSPDYGVRIASRVIEVNRPAAFGSHIRTRVVGSSGGRVDA
ncbi:MAG TPA: alginate lyase family protein [Gemmatimonadaceae bacterium]|nr:alginate lyase family protein [Gemmatimonadaceae bacterium]